MTYPPDHPAGGSGEVDRGTPVTASPESPSPPPPPVESSASAEPSPRRPLFWGLLGGCLLLFVLITAGSVGLAYWSRGESPSWNLGSSVGVVTVEGEIWESRSIVEELHDYRDDGRVKAIVVRIDSPGGAIVPSQEIYEAILEMREQTDKPIVASMAGLAASGGYYVAAACDRIVANEGTVTGSIGVIAQWLNYEGVLEWARISPVTITSGSMKDVGNPFREMQPEEQAYFQALLAEMHGQFIDAVLVGRDGALTREELMEIADGRVYTGAHAVEIGLADDVGTMWDAVDIASEMAGVEDPNVIWPRPYTPTLFDMFIGSEKGQSVVSRLLPTSSSRPVLLYRWY